MIEKVARITLSMVFEPGDHKNGAHRDGSVELPRASEEPPRRPGHGLLLPARNPAPGKLGDRVYSPTWGDHRIGPAGPGKHLRPRTWWSGASSGSGRYWDRTSDLFGVNEALSP